MKTEASVEIDRPIEEVFEFTNYHVAEWSKTVVEDEVIEEKPGRVGTTFRSVTADRGHRMEFMGTVTRHEPPHASACYLAGSSFDLEVEYAFKDLRGRTRVTQRATIKGKGLMKVMLPVMGWVMRKSSCRAITEELENLKRLLEQRDGDAFG